MATATIIERTSLQSVRDAVSLGALAGWFGREIIGVTGPDVDRKSDKAWTSIGVENYRRVDVERHWPPEQYEAWLTATLAATLAWLSILGHRESPLLVPDPVA